MAVTTDDLVAKLSSLLDEPLDTTASCWTLPVLM